MPFPTVSHGVIVADHRPFELIEIEITKTGSERAAIKNTDMAALWADGWDIAYCWVARRQEVENNRPKGPEQSFLMVVMAPPKATAMSRTATNLEQLLDRLESLLTPAQAVELPAESSGFLGRVPWWLVFVGWLGSVFATAAYSVLS